MNCVPPIRHNRPGCLVHWLHKYTCVSVISFMNSYRTDRSRSSNFLIVASCQLSILPNSENCVLSQQRFTFVYPTMKWVGQHSCVVNICESCVFPSAVNSAYFWSLWIRTLSRYRPGSARHANESTQNEFPFESSLVKCTVVRANETTWSAVHSVYRSRTIVVIQYKVNKTQRCWGLP